MSNEARGQGDSAQVEVNSEPSEPENRNEIKSEINQEQINETVGSKPPKTKRTIPALTLTTSHVDFRGGDFDEDEAETT